MKKKVLLTAGLAAAMTVGTVITSFAGWEMHGGDWYYYKDSNHEMVTDDWAKSGEFWYYLGDDGKMLTSTMIDDSYYVDANGAMTVNGWQYVADDWDEEPAWRYFTSNGRAYKDGIKLINGSYYHFEDTKMSTGWIEVDDTVYYFREDGSMATGWKWLTENDEDGWNEYWYYFGSNGKMTKNTERTVDGVKYAFDDDGRMLTGWVASDFTSSGTDNLSTSNIDDLKYYDENGAAVNGWLWLESPDDYESNYYYFKNGSAYTKDYKTTVPDGCDYGVAKIDGDYYCFDSDGQMVTGIVDTANGPMYFDVNSGKMRTGRVTVYDEDYYGETFYFKESGSIGTRGVGITGVNGGYLYEEGKTVCAEDGLRYDRVEVDGKEYVVNESGKIKTSGTAKDSEGLKYTIKKGSDGGYVITEEFVD